MDNTSSYSASFCGEYRVKHILIKPIITNNMDAEQIAKAKEVAKEKAQDVILKLVNGTNWSSLVKKYSDDKLSAVRDGLMKNFRQGEVEEVLFETVEKLRDGRYTEYPVEASDGYHILFRISKTEDEEDRVEENKTTEEEQKKENESSTSTQEKTKQKNSSNDNSYDYTDESQSSSKQSKKKSYGISDYDYDSISEATISRSYAENQFSENTIENQIEQIVETNATGQSGVSYTQNVDGSWNVNGNIDVTQHMNINFINTNIDQPINIQQPIGGSSSTSGMNVEAQINETQPANNVNIGGVNVRATVESQANIGVGVGQPNVMSGNSVTAGVATQAAMNGVQSGTGAPNIGMGVAPIIGDGNEVGSQLSDEVASPLATPITSQDSENEQLESPENLDENVLNNSPVGQAPNGVNGGMDPRQTLRNTGNSSKLQERLERSRGKNLFNNLLNRNNNQNGEDSKDNKGLGQKAGEKLAEKGASTAAQKLGVPKPLADKASKELVGPMLDAFKKKYQKQIIIVVCCVVAIFLIILVPILILAGDSDYQAANSAERSEYLYGSGTDEELYEYLKDIGVCSNSVDCASSDAAAFYKKLKSTLDNNANLTQKHADSFIIKMIFYERENKEGYKKSDEIEYIANIIGSNGAFNINTADNYKEEFIKEGGYFDTYRADLLTEDNSIEYKEKMYAEIVQNSVNLINQLNEQNTSNGVQNGLLVCPEITVTGELAGTYELEEYVAKVVTSENNWAPNGNLESMKAQAVTARTYALRITNNCTKTIENSTKNQTMKAEATANATAAAQAVAGQVLVNSNGNYISTEYDAFCLASIDDDNYYIVQKNLAIPKTWADNQSISKSWKTTVCGNEGDGGHGRGMSQWGANYLVSTGYTYDQVLSFFYEDATLKVLTSISTGLSSTSNGFLKRTSRALRDNAYFYGDGAYNEGECAWYAVRRTNEILGNSGINKRVTSGGNGGDFCQSADYSSFHKVYDIEDLEPGMVISWSGGSHGFGHVAIIEDVYYDSQGKVESIDISEGSNSSGNGYNTYYGGNLLNNNFIWSLGSTNYKQEVRQYNCEGSLDGSTGTGCQKFTNLKANKIKNRWSSYNFECAIDLIS